ncbi:hypothetical protein LINPERPRIM_LOCUS25445 [Linum perenne]
MAPSLEMLRISNENDFDLQVSFVPNLKLLIEGTRTLTNKVINKLTNPILIQIDSSELQKVVNFRKLTWKASMGEESSATEVSVDCRFDHSVTLEKLKELLGIVDRYVDPYGFFPQVSVVRSRKQKPWSVTVKEEAMSWMQSMGYMDVDFESDAKIVVDSLKDSTEFGDIIEQCTGFEVIFGRRSRNMVANTLARRACNLQSPTCGLSPPEWVVASFVGRYFRIMNLTVPTNASAAREEEETRVAELLEEIIHKILIRLRPQKEAARPPSCRKDGPTSGASTSTLSATSTIVYSNLLTDSPPLTTGHSSA